MITMRLFAEEKRTGTIELLATSPIRDMEIIIGKWLAALVLYACMLLFTAVNFAFLFQLRQSRLEAAGHRLSRPVAAGGRAAGDRDIYFHPDQEPDHRRRRNLRRVNCCYGWWAGSANTKRPAWAQCFPTCRSSRTSNRSPGRARFEGRSLLSHGDFPGALFHGAFHGILALEVVVRNSVRKSLGRS